ncbi:MAG: MBOAT family protein [Bacteroidetes bacterium]|nr:MBOAT family protein [Bacteroidota bacterium]
MLFNSVAFLIFLPCVVILFYLLPHRFRWILLLASSYLFYGWWKVEFLALIIFSTVLDYVVARLIYFSRFRIIRIGLLLISLGANLGLLFLFKYYIMFSAKPEDDMLFTIYMVDFPFKALVLYGIYYAIPVGISFYTFQTLSYTLDVFNRKAEPEKHLGKFALFVSFFPQLVAGPIERFTHLMPQLKKKVEPLYENFSNAFRLMLFGFFVKICVADNLSLLVDQVYANPDAYNLFSRWFGTIGFGFQIYADFAGYSLIAQGAALCLGVNLMDNFKTPYLSVTITEFWKRWHISLSTWFRDYLYIPLGGNRVNVFRWAFNILLVFAISGMWHGANKTFLIWGLIHGGLYLVERFIFGNKTGESKFLKASSALVTFLGVQLAWVFFRSKSTQSSIHQLASLFDSGGNESLIIKGSVILILIIFILSDLVLYNRRIDSYLGTLSKPVRWSVYTFFLWSITAWGGTTDHPFIYFQF